MKRIIIMHSSDYYVSISLIQTITYHVLSDMAKYFERPSGIGAEKLLSLATLCCVRQPFSESK